MKNINPLVLFDEHVLLERLTKLKDPLVILEGISIYSKAAYLS